MIYFFNIKQIYTFLLIVILFFDNCLLKFDPDFSLKTDNFNLYQNNYDLYQNNYDFLFNNFFYFKSIIICFISYVIILEVLINNDVIKNTSNNDEIYYLPYLGFTGDGCPAGSIIPEDSIPLLDRYNYPTADGKIKIPYNQIPLSDTFIIPNKPYFIENKNTLEKKINFPLLNRDILEYSKLSMSKERGEDFSPKMIKMLEMSYGYGLTRHELANLEFHRKNTPSYVNASWLFRFIKWYYKKSHKRLNYSIWFTSKELEETKNFDFYDFRIYNKIYTTGHWSKARPYRTEGF